MNYWFRIDYKSIGKKPEQTTYINAYDAVAAIDKSNKTLNTSPKAFRTVKKLSKEKASKLERYIEKELKFTLHVAKRRGILFREENPPV